MVPRVGGGRVDGTRIQEEIDHYYSEERGVYCNEYSTTKLPQADWQQTSFWCQAFYCSRLGVCLVLVARHEESLELTLSVRNIMFYLCDIYEVAKRSSADLTRMFHPAPQTFR